MPEFFTAFKPGLPHCLIVCVAAMLLINCGGSSGGSKQGGGGNGGLVDNPPPVEEVQQLTVNVNSTLVNGRLLLNSEPYSRPGEALVLERGLLSLQAESLGGDEIEVGELGDENFQLSVLDDTYQPIYRYQQGLVFLGSSNTEASAADDFVIVTPPTESETELPKNAVAGLAGVLDVESPGSWDIDVSSLSLEMRLLLDGATFPNDDTEDAQIYLRPQASNILIALGSSNSQLATVELLPDIYDVVYQYVSGLQIPKNEHHVMETIDLRNATVGSIRTESLNVETTTSRVSFSLNGEDFPNSAYDYGLLNFQNGLDKVEAGRSYDQYASIRLIQGEYDAHFQARETANLMPRNTDVVIGTNYILDAGSSVVNLNVESVEISGDFLVNSIVAEANAYDYGKVYLQDTQTAAQYFLGDTLEQNYGPFKIAPGSYQLYYEMREGGNSVPVNAGVLLPDVIDINADNPSQQVDVNIPVITVEVQLTLDGSAFPNSAYDYADIYLRRIDNNEEILLGTTFEELSANVIPGNYDIYYKVRQSTGKVPRNTHVRVQSNLLLVEDSTIELDIESRLIQLIPTLNGEDFPQSAYLYAELHIGSDPTERILTNNTYEDGEVVRVIAGNYAVYFTARQTGSGIEFPVNRNAKITEVLVNP